jgi:hypothetical protein
VKENASLGVYSRGLPAVSPCREKSGLRQGIRRSGVMNSLSFKVHIEGQSLKLPLDQCIAERLRRVESGH